MLSEIEVRERLARWNQVPHTDVIGDLMYLTGVAIFKEILEESYGGINKRINAIQDGIRTFTRIKEVTE